MAQLTVEELLELVFHDNYEHLKGKRLRMTRLRVPGKEVCLAHIITPTDPAIYQNLALHIGVHAGEDHTGEGDRHDPPHSVGNCRSCRRHRSEGRRHPDRIYGPLLRFPDHHRRLIAGTDRSKRGRPIFWGRAAF